MTGEDDRPTGAAPSLSTRLMRLAGQQTDITPDFDKVRADVAEAARRRGAVPRLFGDIERQDGFDRLVAESRRAVEENPSSALALLRLADALRDRGSITEATEIYRRCADIDAVAIPARYFLAALGAGRTPGAMPREMVVSLFDHYADTFEDVLVGALKYQGPSLLRQAVETALGGPRQGLDIMDAGCGTGLCAEAFRPMARRLDGIDISPEMIAKARQKGLYDSLICDELCAALATMERRYDVVVAADVLIYIGDLDPVFAAAVAALRGTGLLAFTIECMAGGDYALSSAGRYRHNGDYVAAAAARAGFAIVLREDCTIRFEHGSAVPGASYVLSPG